MKTVMGTLREYIYFLCDSMYFIDPKTVPQKDWTAHGEYWIPTHVSAKCPNPDCQKGGVFALHLRFSENNWTKTSGFTSECYACRQKVQFFLTGSRNRKQNKGCDAIWMDPDPDIKKSTIDPNSVPFEIFDAYKEAIECFNNGHWRAVVTECGRALEGITQDKFPETINKKALKEISDVEDLGLGDIFSLAQEALNGSDIEGQALSKKQDKLEVAKSKTESAVILFAPLLKLTKVIRLAWIIHEDQQKSS